MNDTKKIEELNELKSQSKKKGTYRSIFMTMGILSIGLPCTLYNSKVGMAIMASGIIPMLIDPEIISGNRKKIKRLEKKTKKTL